MAIYVAMSQQEKNWKNFIRDSYFALYVIHYFAFYNASIATFELLC